VSKDRAPSGSPVAVEVAAPPIGTVHQPPVSSSTCVLLVEDDQVLRAVSADTLNDLGYRTIRTSDGMQALTALERDRDIRILMTDIGLPGMDGQQLAAEARRRRPGLGVLFVTGYDGLIREGRLHREEGVEYLAKPYGCDDLAKALRRLLGSESKSRM
jgi:CheY-like chemotaxis protein